MLLSEPLLTGRPLISAYGRGGFKLGGISHPGSLLILPEGLYAWPVGDAAMLTSEMLRPVLDRGAPLGFLILGTGQTQIFPSPELRRAFTEAGLGLDAMDTGAACRTYNVLLGEERVFAAALIATP
jgi:uncharacterized protein